MRSQTSSELEKWLVRIESFHPIEIDLGLDRIRAVADILACSEFNCPVITVGGTNGKGSTVESLKQLALAKRLRVGTYTSPHLFKFNERIAINGIFVSDENLIKAFELIEEARCRNPLNIISLSFFEFTTLAAFVIFKESNLDLIVLEVGLGGRLDGVNIVDANVAIITSIGIDHTAWLGDTREKIAIEKAGIARNGRLCIVGEPLAPENLFPHLTNVGAKILQINKDFHFNESAHEVHFHLFDEVCPDNRFTLKLERKKLNLAPANIILALQAFHSMDLKIDDEDAGFAISQAQLLGRFQIFNLNTRGKVICDLTHNQAGAVFFYEQVKNYFSEGLPKSITILLGVMSDKDIGGIANIFLDLADEWLACDMNSPRAARASALKEIISEAMLVNKSSQDSRNIHCFDSVSAGLDSYLKSASNDSCLLVIGSFFSVAPVIELLTQTKV